MRIMHTVVVIPARMDSERLPGKPLLMKDGKALLHWTYDQACKTDAAEVIVTSADKEVWEYCRKHEIPFSYSKEKHTNGTSRCLEIADQFAAKSLDRFLVVNWQCDEPLVDPKYVDKLIVKASAFPFDIWTLVTKGDASGYDENTVKVVMSMEPFSRALWFSRASMRGASLHCGVYAYSYDQLEEVGRLDPTDLSKAESLEQLTWLENSKVISGVFMDEHPLSINTSEDWERFQPSESV